MNETLAATKVVVGLGDRSYDILIGPGLIEQPRYRPRESALADPACRAWVER